jgi:phage terminase Nu1 subunit (DNA packaging protein)
MRVKRGKTQSDRLKGWQRISEFLGEPLSVVQRWAHEGMPVHKEGKSVIASRDELNAWLGKQSGKPARAATETTDLTKELKRGLAFVRGEK